MEADITMTIEEEPVVNMTYVEGKLKPEIVGQATPSYEPQTVTPPVGSVFSAVEVGAIPEPTETETYTENGTYDVSRIGTAIVQVPQGVFPAGTLPITTNGPYDVTGYAGVDVAVPIVFDLGIVTLELLTVTVAEDYNGALGGAMAALYARVSADKKTGGVNGHGIVYLSLVDAPSATDQLVSWGAHFNSSGIRQIGRRYDGSKIIVQGNPAINSWAANLKTGTTYKMAWFTLN